MILSGKEIVKHMGKEIVIEPFDPKRVNPNSYNLSLYNELMVYNDRELDMAKQNSVSVIRMPEVSKLPIRQFTYRPFTVFTAPLSKLPIRQFTCLLGNGIIRVLSKLPIRQFTRVKAAIDTIIFSKLPIRQFTP